jgi:hypothetical protein
VARKPKYSTETCSIAVMSATDPICMDPGSNPGPHGGNLASNRLIYRMVHYIMLPVSWRRIGMKMYSHSSHELG